MSCSRANWKRKQWGWEVHMTQRFISFRYKKDFTSRKKPKHTGKKSCVPQSQIGFRRHSKELDKIDSAQLFMSNGLISSSQHKNIEVQIKETSWSVSYHRHLFAYEKHLEQYHYLPILVIKTMSFYFQSSSRKRWATFSFELQLHVKMNFR